MKVNLISLILIAVSILTAQTQIPPKQLNLIIYAIPPETVTFFATQEQSVFIISTATSVSITKTVVYLNGVRQTELKKPSTGIADFTLSVDKKTVTFYRTLDLEETVVIDYWVR